MPLMDAGDANVHTDLTLSDWGADGIASFEATGNDRRSVLEAALRATLALAGIASSETSHSHNVRSAPIRGEGDDLALLLADLIDDLLDQAAYFGAGLRNVTLDGLLRRDDGGFIAWGYASGTPEKGSALTPLSLHGEPEVSEQGDSEFVVRASFARG